MYILSGNWVVSNLENALNTWNSKLGEIWNLISKTPETFKDGAIWNVIESIYGSVQAVGFALLVLFFVVGAIKTCGSITEIKRPEHAFKLFLRFAIAKIIVTHGLELMMTVFKIVRGLIGNIMSIAGINNATETVLPPEIIQAINDTGFIKSIPLWAVTLIGGLVVTVLSFIMILTVYGRFFKIYLYIALSPVLFSTFAGEPTQNIGKTFLKSFCGVCLEGAIIVLACIIFSLFASSPPVIDSSAPAVTQVWVYIGEVVFNMLVLVGTIKMSDRIVKEMTGM